MDRKGDDYRGLMLAEAYVPMQKYRDLYDIFEGLERGTIFKELYRPYAAGKDRSDRYYSERH